MRRVLVITLVVLLSPAFFVLFLLRIVRAFVSYLLYLLYREYEAKRVYFAHGHLAYVQYRERTKISFLRFING